MKWLQTNSLLIAGIVLGAIAGIVYWKYVGCLDNTCTISASPWRSTIYFALLGALLANTIKKPSSTKQQ